ncbi:GDP-mannose 4,6 dehydratase 2 [Spatholobus suberectus]|nr:GDP-mannose 4,6 dehydratase 2 [Spatholobus suberectus]
MLCPSAPRTGTEDATKAKNVLDWKPKVGFQQLVKMMVDQVIEMAKKEKVDPSLIEDHKLQAVSFILDNLAIPYGSVK